MGAEVEAAAVVVEHEENAPAAGWMWVVGEAEEGAAAGGWMWEEVEAEEGAAAVVEAAAVR
eukprot:4675578-Pleurochrysis_carterae.AAC.2